MEVFSFLFLFLSKKFNILGLSISFLDIFIVGCISAMVGCFVGKLFRGKD